MQPPITKETEQKRPDLSLYPVLKQTGARWDFSAAKEDVLTLIAIHDEKTQKQAGRPDQQLEALKRSALILSVTAWE